MRPMLAWLPLLVLGACVVCESRRVPVHRPLPQEAETSEEEQETVNYYAAEPRDEEGEQRVVLVSSADRYNGLYGQPSPTTRASSASAAARHQDEEYVQRGGGGGGKGHHVQTRTKETPRQPPVQTIRNYNKVNDDGSFTFGYEAADGSFKEETRGTDCVVRGKYGYVDPDGNKREFTYVSGNPCDPNAPKEEEEEEERERESDEAPDQPANYPTRPVVQLRRPVPTAAPKPTVTLFQNNYAREEEQPEPEQLLRVTPQPYRRPTYITRPQYVPQDVSPSVEDPYARQQVLPSTTPASVIYKSSLHPISITPRPVSVSPSATPRSQLPATTYRPQLLQVSATPRPVLYSKQPLSLSTPKSVDFESEFQRFQQENDVASSSTTTPRPKALLDPSQVYSTALVYDPTTGQYNNQLYQSLPQGDVLLKQRIQPYVQQQRTPPVLNIQQLRQQSPLYSQNLRPQQQQVNQQTAYRQQQQELQFQNSAQLYAQQQRARAQQEQQQQQQQQQQQLQQRQQARQHPVYYIQPSSEATGALATSQLDAFLRGHNIQF